MAHVLPYAVRASAAGVEDSVETSRRVGDLEHAEHVVAGAVGVPDGGSHGLDGGSHAVGAVIHVVAAGEKHVVGGATYVEYVGRHGWEAGVGQHGAAAQKYDFVPGAAICAAAVEAATYEGGDEETGAVLNGVTKDGIGGPDEESVVGSVASGSFVTVQSEKASPTAYGQGV